MKKHYLPKFSTILFLALLIMTLGASATLAVSEKNYILPEPEIIAELDGLNIYISELSDTELNRGLRKSLSQKLNAAKNAYVRGNPCTAVNILDAYLNHTSALIKGKVVQVAEDLRNRGWMLRNNLLLNLPEGEKCKGFESLDQAPEVRIKTSDNQHFAASVSFGLPVLGSVKAGGETWTQLTIPALQSYVGEPGMPAIPTWHVLVAVPRGARIKMKVATPQILSEILANLYPFQEQAVDGPAIDQDFEFVDPPFVKNEDLYETNAFFPPDPCSVEIVGNIRDLNVAQLTCVGGRYNPVTKALQLYSDIDFEILFEGGDGMFITDRSLSPFETASKSNLEVVINRTAVQQYIDPVDISQLVPYGEEMLILTHPDFREAADELAQWKRDKGITTTVIEVGIDTVEYATGNEIDDMIEWRYDNCVVRPSYILLLGDVEYIPPASTNYSTRADETTGSDYGYAIYPQFIFDIFPDFAVGRISVDTLTEAQRVVDKIIQYESDPPFVDIFMGAPFYTTAANTAQFQGFRMNPDGSPLNGLFGIAQRSFIETSELVRDEMMANGHTVERIYTATEDNGGYCLDENVPCTRQQPYTGLDIPNRYHNGSLLPADLRLGSGFTWDGDTDDIINAFNEGRFLILHRDHGSNSGFVHPSFRTWHFVDLENTELLPVVYSVNCASGYFDVETDTNGTAESFMELLLLEEDGGMVGGLGDNRNSPTWENSALTRGFYDATWTAVAPEFGDNTSIRRLGDILNHGKMYLTSQIGVGQTAGSINVNKALDELIMWHVFGDPTLEMWTANPYKMQLKGEHILERVVGGLEVSYEVNGAVITAFQVTEDGTVPVGRSVVKNQVAEIPFFYPPKEGVPIVLSASFKNAVSVLLTPTSALPDLVIEQIVEESTLIVSPGDDLTELLVIRVSNLGDGDASGTVGPDGAPQSGYMIDLVLSRDTTIPEGWATLPDSSGVIFVEDGLLHEGRISLTPDVPAASSVELSTDSSFNSDLGGIIPTLTPPGHYYLCARIDPGDEVKESNEDNNVICLPVEVVDNTQ